MTDGDGGGWNGNMRMRMGRRMDDFGESVTKRRETGVWMPKQKHSEKRKPCYLRFSVLRNLSGTNEILPLANEF